MSFIPLGMIIKHFKQNVMSWRLVIVGITYSIILETIQYILELGVTDIIDIMVNGLGCGIGVMTCAILIKLNREYAKRHSPN